MAPVATEQNKLSLPIPQKNLNLTAGSAGSFSGADFRIFAVVASTQSPIEDFPTIQTLSYSTFRESMSVRALGQVSERGRTKGPRTIAGSMVFTLVGNHPFADFSNHVVQTTKDYVTTKLFYNDLTDQYETGSLDGVNVFKQTETGLVQTDFNQLVDTLPPFDIIISGANDLGFMVQANLFGVRLHAEGAVFSIHDIYTEITCQYTATDMIPLRAIKRDTNGFGPEELLYNKARLGNMPTTFDRVVKEDLETSNKYLQITRNPYL